MRDELKAEKIKRFQMESLTLSIQVEESYTILNCPIVTENIDCHLIPWEIMMLKNWYMLLD